MILESLISLSCATFSGNAHDACQKALEATTKQTDVEKDVHRVEDRVSKQADQTARAWVGDNGMTAGAFVGGAGKAIVDRAATIKIPVWMPQFFINIQVGATKNMAGVEWKF